MSLSSHRSFVWIILVAALAAGALGTDEHGYRAELVSLVKRASGLTR